MDYRRALYQSSVKPRIAYKLYLRQGLALFVNHICAKALRCLQVIVASKTHIP